MIKERRRHPRLRIPLEAEYLVAGEDEWHEGTIWTLGAGGAALLCETPLERGTVLAGLHFVVAAEGDLPETRIEVGADVVSSELQDDVGRSGNFMLGLQFRDLGEQEFELLRQFVFRRLTGSPRSPAQDEAASRRRWARHRSRFASSSSTSLSKRCRRASRPVACSSAPTGRCRRDPGSCSSSSSVRTSRSSRAPRRSSGRGGAVRSRTVHRAWECAFSSST